MKSPSISTSSNNVRIRKMENIHQHRMLDFLLLCSPVVVCLLIMLPRLLSPQFGLMDDGRMISTVTKINHGTWDMSYDAFAGRFRPVYWFYYALIYAVFGSQPFWFFAGNTLVYAVTVICLIKLIQSLGGSWLQAWLVGLFFAFAGPTIENYYTLSKAEPLQLLWLLLSLLLVARYPSKGSWLRRAGLLLAVTVAILLAFLTKETSLIVLPIALTWFLTGWILSRMNQERVNLAARGVYLAASFLSTALFFGTRNLALSSGLTTGSYTDNYSFTLSRILASTVRWSGWFIRDFLYILPLILIVGLWGLRKRRLSQSVLLIDILIWTAAWAAVYLPWIYTQEYYMLPFSIGISALGGLLLGQVLQLFPGLRNSGKIFVTGGLAASAFFLFASIATNLSNAGIQLSVDAANAATLDYLAANLPSHSAVLVNIQDPNEYFEQSQSSLGDIRGRTDLQLSPFAFQESVPIAAGLKSYYLISPFIEHQPLLTVRMGVIEASQKVWNESMLQYYGSEPPVIFQARRSFRLFNFDLPRLLCPFMQGRNYCSAQIPAVDRREFMYGWKVYRIEKP